MIYILYLIIATLLMSFVYNIKQKRKIKELNNNEFSLEQKAYYSEITELPNRENLKIIVDEQISRAARHQKSFVVLAIKIENYKYVKKDSFEIANELIKESGDRLFNLLRDEDSLFHISDNLFVIVFNEYLKEKDLNIIYKKIKKTFMKINPTDLEIIISIGTSVYPIDAKDLKGLLEVAVENTKVKK